VLIYIQKDTWNFYEVWQKNPEAFRNERPAGLEEATLEMIKELKHRKPTPWLHHFSDSSDVVKSLQSEFVSQLYGYLCDRERERSDFAEYLLEKISEAAPDVRAKIEAHLNPAIVEERETLRREKLAIESELRELKGVHQEEFSGKATTQIAELVRERAAIRSAMAGVEVRRLTWLHRMFHDVRQPLQGIVALACHMAQLAGSHSTNNADAIARGADDLENSAQRLALLMDLYDAFTGDRLVPSFVRLHLDKDVLLPTLQVAVRGCRRRSVTITHSHLDHLPSIVSDPRLLSVAFHVLLDNALKYSAERSEIAVIGGVKDKCVAVEVVNHGRPVGEDEKARIFDEGYRGAEAMQMCGGLGVGLYVAKRIARRLNGDILLIDGGTESGRVIFRLLLPMDATNNVDPC
jgi:signal transduction histidine kinase